LAFALVLTGCDGTGSGAGNNNNVVNGGGGTGTGNGGTGDTGSGDTGAGENGENGTGGAVVLRTSAGDAVTGINTVAAAIAYVNAAAAYAYEENEEPEAFTLEINQNVYSGIKALSRAGPINILPAVFSWNTAQDMSPASLCMMTAASPEITPELTDAPLILLPLRVIVSLIHCANGSPKGEFLHFNKEITPEPYIHPPKGQ